MRQKIVCERRREKNAAFLTLKLSAHITCVLPPLFDAFQNLKFLGNFCVFFRNMGKQSNFSPEIFPRGFSMMLNLMVQKLSKSVQISKSYGNLNNRLRENSDRPSNICSNFFKSEPILIILILFDS